MKNFLNTKKLIKNKKIFSLAAISILTGLSASFIQTIWALYIDSFVHSVFLVGLISALITVIAFLSYFFVIPLVEKKDKVKLYLLSISIYILSYILFSFTANLAIFLIIALPLAFFGSLRTTSFGILIKDFSKRKNLAKNEGFLYAIENIAWVIGPLIAGYLSSSFGFKIVFLVSAIILIFAFFTIKFSKMKDVEIKKKIDGKILRNFFDFFKNKKRVFAYLLSGGVSIWWALIYIFIPVYIVEQGFSNLLVGYFLFAIAIPLVLFEYRFSVLASKKGFRKIFRRGYLITAIFCFTCFFFTNIYFILSFLILASVGMAMLESTTEAYFFDILDRKQHLRFYGPFNTADSALSLTSKLLASAVLFFLPFKYLFILFGTLMMFYVILTFFIKDSFECRRN